MERLTESDLRMARRLATKKNPSDSNVDSVLARVPAMVEEIERLRAAASPLSTPGIDIGEAEDLALQLGDWLNHEAMDSGDPGGRLRDFAGAVTRLLGKLAAAERVVHAAREWAESTRIWPPNGDDDALNHLLEVAQDSYNKTLPGEGRDAPSVVVARDALSPLPVEEGK